MADFPDELTHVIAGISEIKADHINQLRDKVGADNSEVVTSLDYLLKNAASVDPGHGHTLAAVTDITALAAELNLLDLAELAVGMVLRATGVDSAAWGAIQLADITYSGLTEGHFLRATGETAASFGAIQAGDLPTAIDAAKIADGSVSNQEFQHLGGVTSDVQTQLNAKAPAASPTLTGSIALNGITAAAYLNDPTYPALIGQFRIYSADAQAAGKGGVLSFGGAYTDVGDSTLWAAIGGIKESSVSGEYAGSLIFVTRQNGDVGSEKMRITSEGNVGFNVTSFGADAAKVIALGNGTAPSSSPADAFQLYSADQAAGNACPHIRTEAGDVIKLFKGSALTNPLDALTFTAPGTPDYALQDLTDTGGYGFATKDEGNTVLAIIANLQARVNELEARLQAHGLLA